ncbi:unnamed protein product [Cylindrotheca closterium]|uniref:Uncharacterized protein n=1 Tax=Cylindrotheca closterium TaxID=2856 RepID=A0AAD2FFC6_9STRA|nr:unnamed protein product [Cylindrotheca closterium]
MHSQAHRSDPLLQNYADWGDVIYLNSSDGNLPSNYADHDPKWNDVGNNGPSLDTGSTFHLCKDFENAEEETVQDLTHMFNCGTNIGSGRTLTQEVQAKHMEDQMCKFDPEAICDVGSASLLVKQGYRIVVDTDKDNAFIVSKDGRQWVYREKNGLYTYVPGKLELMAQIPEENQTLTFGPKPETHCGVCMELGPQGEACLECARWGSFVKDESYHQ